MRLKINLLRSKKISFVFFSTANVDELTKIACQIFFIC